MQLTDAQSAGADVVFLPIYYQPASIIFAQADAMGYEPTFFGVDGMDGILTLKNFDMSLAEGVMVLTPFSADATDERTVNFVTKYSEQFGETPNQFAADGYDCIYALKQAMENAGCTPDMSAEDICDAMIEQFTTMSFDASPAPASPGAPTARQQDANGCRDSRRRVCQRRKRRLKLPLPGGRHSQSGGRQTSQRRGCRAPPGSRGASAASAGMRPSRAPAYAAGEKDKTKKVR